VRADDDLGYEPPSKDQVEDALLVLGDDQHRRLFYQGLQNPLWVEPLDKIGAFNEVPALFQDAQGCFRSKGWPEGEYLVRMAEYVPSKVTPILVRMAKTEDPFARRMIVAAAARLDGENAAKVSKLIGRYLTSDGSRRVPPQEIGRIIEALMADGKSGHALKLASCAFGPREATDADGSGGGYARKRVATGIEDYAYGETLAAVSIAIAPLGLKWLGELRRWLQRYQVLARNLEVADGDDADEVVSDLSYAWRPSIPAHEQNHDFDEVGNGLVDALRDASTRALTDGCPATDVVGPLMASRQALLRRIGIHTITVAIALGLGDAQTLAADVLSDEQYLEANYRHEYAEFARRALPLATAEVLTTWTRSVLEGPTATDEEIRGWLAWRYQGAEVPQDAVDERRRTWQMRILSAIGTGMPASAAERLADLQAEFGAWENAGFSRYVSSGWGETAPAEMDEIASWSIPEVVEFLRSWSEPTDSAFAGPSYSGVTFAFMEDVKSRPVEYAEAAGLFTETDSRYVASLFNAFQTVTSSGIVFPWGPVVQLGASLAEPGCAELVGRV